MSQADDSLIAQLDDGVIGIQQCSVLDGPESHLLAATGRSHEPHEPSDEPAHQRVSAQQRPPVGTGPGPSTAHGLIQPGGLEGQDRFSVFARCAQLLLSRISVETALGYARFGQGLEGLPGGIGQHDPELGSEPPGELALPVAQAQQAVRIEATGGNGPIRKLLSAPAAPLRNLLDQADSGLLNGAHLVPAGSGLQQGESIGMPVGRQDCQKSCELGAVLALGTLRLTHVGGDRIRQFSAVHAHGQSQQSLVGNGGTHE